MRCALVTEESVLQMNDTTRKAQIQKTKDKLADMLLNVASECWKNGEYSQLVKEWRLLGSALGAAAAARIEACSVWNFLIETVDCVSLRCAHEELPPENVQDIKSAFAEMPLSGIGAFYLYDIYRINQTKPFTNSFNYLIRHLEEKYNQERLAYLAAQEPAQS